MENGNTTKIIVPATISSVRRRLASFPKDKKIYMNGGENSGNRCFWLVIGSVQQRYIIAESEFSPNTRKKSGLKSDLLLTLMLLYFEMYSLLYIKFPIGLFCFFLLKR